MEPVSISPKRITVVANGSEVTLSGTVRCCAECRAAERTAWCAPGITKVDNRITVNPPSVASAVETEAGVA
jgi:osmotically-inducible protein OsmY